MQNVFFKQLKETFKKIKPLLFIIYVCSINIPDWVPNEKRQNDYEFGNLPISLL